MAQRMIARLLVGRGWRADGASETPVAIHVPNASGRPMWKRRPLASLLPRSMARARAHRACAVARRLRWPEWIPASAEAVGASAFSESEGFVQICPEGSAHCYSECHFLPAVPRPPTGNSQRRSGANRVRLAPTSDGKHGWLRAGRERKRHFALSCARPARRVAVARGTCDPARQHVAIVRRPRKKHPAWREYSRILRGRRSRGSAPWDSRPRLALALARFDPARRQRRTVAFAPEGASLARIALFGVAAVQSLPIPECSIR